MATTNQSKTKGRLEAQNRVDRVRFQAVSSAADFSMLRCGKINGKVAASMDNLSRKDRSRTMAAVRGVGTVPEMAVRRGLHALGFRYRLHVAELPGKPDLVLARWNAVIFVNGCFWHGHGCERFRMPSSRIEYWGPKILRNRERDRRTADQLRKLGWRVLRVWECELLANPDAAIGRLVNRVHAS